jgi:predicted ester cyclase
MGKPHRVIAMSDLEANKAIALGLVEVFAEGDKVVLVDRFGGTHRGKFFGRPGTGDRIEWMAIHIYTIRDGKVLEDAVMTDALAIMQQLGLAPGA